MIIKSMPKNPKSLKKVPNLYKNEMVKAYNMAILDDDTAEINMYGDVVSVAPTDWSTGERIAGYIGVDEFLEDLENIKDKSNITVHINSGGGDLYAGLAIYNRLKAVKGTVTTINDGLAASAASLIFQAGNKRLMNAGSNLMAHGVAGFLFGYYNIEDLETLTTQYKAHNKAIVNVYAKAMRVSYAEAKKFVKGETWLTGQEAVDIGLADEVVEEDEPDVPENFINSLMHKAQNCFSQNTYSSVETSSQIINSTKPVKEQVINKTIEGGKNKMDINTVAELKNAFPTLVAQIEDSARQEGAESERERLRGIEEIQNTVSDQAIINDAKYGKNPLTAEQLALKAMKAQAAIGSNMINDMIDDTKKSGVENIIAEPHNAEKEEEDEEKKKEKEEEEAKNLAKLVNGMR